MPLIILAQDDLEDFYRLKKEAQNSENTKEQIQLRLVLIKKLKNQILLANTLSLKWAKETPIEFAAERNTFLLKNLIANNWLGHYDRADSVAKIIVPYFKAQNDSIQWARSLIELGITQRRRMKLDSSYESIKKAIELLKENTKWSSDFHYANYQLGSSLSSLERIGEVKKHSNHFYFLTDSLKDYKNHGYFALLQAGLVLKSNPNYNEIRERFLKEALNLSYKTNDCILRGLTFLNLTGLAYQKKDYSSALKYLDDLEENDLCQGKSHENTKQYIYKRKGNVFYKMGNYKSALKFHLLHYNIVTPKLIAHSTSDLTKMDLTYLKNYPNNCYALMNCYQALNQPDSAIYWGKIGLMTSQRLNDKLMEKNFLISLSQNHQSLGNYEIGLTLLQQGVNLKDSINTAINYKDLHEVEAKFELIQNRRQKEQAELESLREKERANKNLIAAISIGFSAVILLFIVWNRLQRKKSKEERAKIEIEQRFLRSQLNPHFSFNALVVLQNLINKGNKKEAGLYLSRYARLYRSILENSRETTIPLDEEIKVLRDYMELQKTRLNDKFEYNITIQENLEIDFFNIPPMMLQPIIENSIEHGFNGIDYKGLIEISIQIVKNRLIIAISDNGKGDTRDDKKVQKRSLSTTINDERIQLMNKDKTESQKTTIETELNNNGCFSQLSFPDNL